MTYAFIFQEKTASTAIPTRRKPISQRATRKACASNGRIGSSRGGVDQAHRNDRRQGIPQIRVPNSGGIGKKHGKHVRG